MSQQLLKKGLEEEVYTGTADGSVVGLSHRISADLQGFATEPDSRNVEYITAPYREYRVLIDRLMAKRCTLRRYLKTIGDYTLVPGSTLSLDPRDSFQISNPENSYYRYIRDTYGTDVVTASTHINVGIDDKDELIRAFRVLRCDASLYLAMSASSPFLDAKPTGFHSSRWHVFPGTPKEVPFFRDHAEFVQWLERQLEIKTMNNSRHLWLSIRPNGSDTPYELDRLELRICDRLSEPALIGGIVSLYEAQIWQVLENPDLDPLLGHDYDYRNRELMDMCRSNESAVARDSFDAHVVDWKTGDTVTARELVQRRYDDVLPIAARHGFADQLLRIPGLLEEGNLAQRWLRLYDEGRTVQEILQLAMEELASLDNDYDPECFEVGA